MKPTHRPDRDSCDRLVDRRNNGRLPWARSGRLLSKGWARVGLATPTVSCCSAIIWPRRRSWWPGRESGRVGPAPVMWHGHENHAPGLLARAIGAASAQPLSQPRSASARPATASRAATARRPATGRRWRCPSAGIRTSQQWPPRAQRSLSASKEPRGFNHVLQRAPRGR